MFAHRRLLLDITAIVFALWVLAFTLGKIAEPLSPAPEAGERWGNTSFSDYLTLMAGKRFEEEGFFDNFFLDNMTVGFPEFSRGWYHYQVPLNSPNSSIYYTHYGSVDGIANGLLRKVGLENLLDFYRVAGVMSTVSLLLWYASASMLFGRLVGLISLVFIGGSLLFLRLTETIAAYSYDFFFAFGAMLFFLIAQRPRTSARQRYLAYSATWTLVFLQASNSPEFVLWLQIFFFGYLWAVRNNPLPFVVRMPGEGSLSARIKRIRIAASWTSETRLALVLASAPVLALGAHFLLVAWALGGAGNAFADITSVVARRTTGFALAEEVPFQDFQLTTALPFIDTQLRFLLRFGFLSAALLGGAFVWTLHMLRGWLPDGERADLIRRSKLLLVFFVGGAAFLVLLPQATVTATEITLRLLLPAIGLLIGYQLVVLAKYLKVVGPWLPKLIVIGLTVFVLFPIVQNRVTGQGTQIDLYIQSAAYTGRTTNEIRILTEFLRNNTDYGDIVITQIDTGDTGFSQYPHPAYEYLADRRIEMVSSMDGVARAVQELELVRASLPDSNPASEVDFYLLLQDELFKPETPFFAACGGQFTNVLDTYEWWIDHRGGVPFVPGAPLEGRTLFWLYQLDPAKIDQCSELIAEGIPLVTPLVTTDVMTNQQVALSASMLEVDSFNQPSQGRSSLVDGDPSTYWHVEFPTRSPEHWVMVDLGAAVRIDLVAIMPRIGAPGQFWDRDQQAFFEGSNDRQQWARIARLSAYEGALDPEQAQWLSYLLENEGSFRYYRLLIRDENFLSVAEFALFSSDLAPIADPGGSLPTPTATPPSTPTPTPAVPLAKPLDHVDAASYLVAALTPEMLEVDSVNQPAQGKERLIDGNPSTFWHVKFPSASPEHWVMVDLGAAIKIDIVAIIPRIGAPGQFWNRDRAVFQGSEDEEAWTDIARLQVDKSALATDEPQWLYYLLENEDSFRYYRLLIRDENFLSAAEFALFSSDLAPIAGPVGSLPTPTATLAPTPTPTLVMPLAQPLDHVDAASYVVAALTPEMLEVDSVNQPAQGKERLIDGNPSTFWHVKFPSASPEHWVMVDLGAAITIDIVAIMPRIGAPGQFWNRDRAVFQGSEDEEAWTDIARLQVDKSALATDEPQWLYYLLENEDSFRYYRLLIRDENFLSAAEFALFSSDLAPIAGPVGSLPTPTATLAPTPTPTLVMPLVKPMTEPFAE